MLDKVLRDVAARGRTVVMTSHDLGRVEDLATRYDVLSKGVISATSHKSELKSGNILTFYKNSLAGTND
jgi:heme exporter protein A